MTIIHRNALHRAALYLLTVLMVPFSFHCIKTPLEPKAPTWTTQLTVPLLDRTYYFADIVNKDPKFDTTGGTILYNPITDEIGYRQGLPADVFKMPAPRGNTINQEIGAIPIDIGTPPTFSVTAADLGISSANFNPSFPSQNVTLSPSQLGLPTGSVLPADFPSVPIDQNFGDTTQFTYIIFANGTIGLQITNNFPFAIQFAGNQLRLLNFNTPADTVETVATFTFAGQIAANSTATSNPVPLSGVKMNGILKLKGTMSTSGATGQTLQNSNTLAATVSFNSPQIQSMVPDPAPPVALNEVFGDSTDFQYLIFDSGQMSLTIANNFPFTISFTGNTVQLVNKNDTTQVVANFVFSGPITSNSTATSNTVPLAGVRQDALLKLKGTVNLSDYFGKTVTGSNNITSTLNLTNGKLQSASINTLNFKSTSVLEVPDSAVKLDDSIMVKLAVFDSGAVRIRIVNNNAVKLSVKFVIAELRDKERSGLEFLLNGTDPQTGILTIDPKDSVVQTVPMSRVIFVSRERQGVDTVSTKFLHFSLEIKTVQATSGYAVINKTDNVLAEVQPTTSFVLGEIQGKIPPQYFDIEQTFDAGIGDIGNNLTLTAFRSAISLSINILSTGLFPTDIDLDIFPVNKNQVQGAPVNISQRINPGDPSTIVIDSVKVNQLMNTFLAASNELPSKFLMMGHVVISPPDVYFDNSNAKAGVGRVVTDDSVIVTMNYAIPVAIGIQNGSLKDTASFAETNIDTTQLGLIESGKIFMNIENTFPVSLDVQMKLLKAQLTDKEKVDTVSPPVLTLPQNLSDPVNYPPIRVAADTTVNRTGVKSYTFVNLIPSDAAKLADASFTAIDLRMMTAGNGLVAQQFRKTDKIRVKTFANVVFNVDTDKLGN